MDLSSAVATEALQDRNAVRSDDPRHASSAPAISDYALIGDCRTAALVSSSGSIDWLCLPNFDGASIFARILGSNGGSFALRPTQPFTSSRRYVGDTAVLETTFETPTGRAKILDCLPVCETIDPMRAMRELLRIVVGIRGTVTFEAGIDVRPDYARHIAKPIRRGRLGWCYMWGAEVLWLRTDISLEQRQTGLHGTFTVSTGERAYTSLSYTRSDPAILPLLGEAADARLEQTTDWWRGWSARIAYDGGHRDAVVRSALTLKLLTCSLSGAVVAAPTTSLPETVGGIRNWDYRYCWLRDAGLITQAMVGLDIKDEARAFIHWMLHATRLTWPRLQVMYDIYGNTRLPESELPHLAGYRGSAPVRIGNEAAKQKQLDVYGEVILAAETFAVSGGKIGSGAARMLAGLGRIVCESWREPDSGIWEVRGPRRHFTFSKLMCWAALDKLVALHRHGAISLGDAVPAYERERDAIAETIETRGYNSELGAYTSELDGDRLDTAVLLMPCVGYKSAGDRRMRSTYALICRRLGVDGLLHRYEPDENDLPGKEGAFGICSFWAVDQLAMRGDVAEAETLFEHLLSFANDVGLLAEEIDPRSGEALGNFPQAFTHVGLINAALAITKAKKAIATNASVGGSP